nr:hypothetical protein [Mycobacterium uberis]
MRTTELLLVGSVHGPLRLGSLVDVCGDLDIHARCHGRRCAVSHQSVLVGRSGLGLVVVTLFFALSNAILIIPLGLTPS